MRIRLAPQARADLDAIWLYVARESSTEYATLVIASITDRFGLFAKFRTSARIWNPPSDQTSAPSL